MKLLKILATPPEVMIYPHFTDEDTGHAIMHSHISGERDSVHTQPRAVAPPGQTRGWTPPGVPSQLQPRVQKTPEGLFHDGERRGSTLRHLWSSGL